MYKHKDLSLDCQHPSKKPKSDNASLIPVLMRQIQTDSQKLIGQSANLIKSMSSRFSERPYLERNRTMEKPNIILIQACARTHTCMCTHPHGHVHIPHTCKTNEKEIPCHLSLWVNRHTHGQKEDCLLLLKNLFNF